MSFNTKIYDSTNNNYNANFDTYIMGNNNIPVDGNLYYNNKFGKVMTSFIVDSGDSILGGNVLVSENVTIHGKCDFKNDLTIGGNVYIPGRIITPSSNLLSGPTGQSGNQGIVGPTGQSGNQGIIGVTGQSGNQGIIGVTGQSGNQGIVGPTGQSGNQGIIGVTGPSGNQGMVGPTGQAGNQGIVGPTGQSGASILPTTNTWRGSNTFVPSINVSGINITNTNTNFKIGYRSLIANTTGVNNTSIGTNSMVVSQTGSSNSGVGVNTLLSNVIGSNNCAFGDGALYASTNNNNTAVGMVSLITLQNGSFNTSIGSNSGKTLFSGTNNTFLGSNTSSSTTALSSSTAIGYNAQVTASNQIVVGTSLETTLIPGSMTCIGTSNFTNINCGGTINMTSTNENLRIGFQSFSANTSGLQNTSYGTYSSKSNTTGSQNTSIGLNSSFSNTIGSKNTSVGTGSLYSAINDNNTGIGLNSGTGLINGSNNSFFGANTSTSVNTINSSTAIGYNAQITASNQIVLGTAVETVRIPGRLFIGNNDVLSLPNPYLSKPTLYSSQIQKTNIGFYDQLKTYNFISLAPGVYSIKFVLNFTLDPPYMVERGTLEYGLSYDQTAITLCKNRCLISTMTESINGVETLLDASLPFIQHEYVIRCFTNATINVNMRLLSLFSNYRNAASTLKVSQCYLIADQVA